MEWTAGAQACAAVSYQSEQLPHHTDIHIPQTLTTTALLMPCSACRLAPLTAASCSAGVARGRARSTYTRPKLRTSGDPACAPAAAAAGAGVVGVPASLEAAEEGGAKRLGDGAGGTPGRAAAAAMGPRGKAMAGEAFTRLLMCDRSSNTWQPGRQQDTGGMNRRVGYSVAQPGGT
jgi:hypothetical protein